MKSVWMTSLFLAMATAVFAADYPKLDSPQNAVRLYYLSLAKGDRATFKRCIHASPEHVDAVSGMAEMSKAILDYRDELAKIDAEAAKGADPGVMLGYLALVDEAEDMNVDFDGDIAVSVSSKGPPVQFRKIGEEWKLDLSSVESIGASELQAESIKLAVPKLRKHLDLVLTMIREKRISPREANGSISFKINSIMVEATREAQKAIREKKK